MKLIVALSAAALLVACHLVRPAAEVADTGCRIISSVTSDGTTKTICVGVEGVATLIEDVLSQQGDAARAPAASLGCNVLAANGRSERLRHAGGALRRDRSSERQDRRASSCAGCAVGNEAGSSTTCTPLHFSTNQVTPI